MKYELYAMLCDRWNDTPDATEKALLVELISFYDEEMAAGMRMADMPAVIHVTVETL